MKHITKHDVKQAFGDRWWMSLIIFCIVLTIGGLVSMAFAIQPRETQVIVQYTAFGGTNFYRNYWYHLWSYGLLMIIVTVAHGALSLKLRQLERRDIALAVLWGAIGILLLILFFAHSIISIARLG